MKGWMYILKCSDNSFYTGSTINLKRRIEQHQSGQGANHTARRLPVQLVYCELFERIDKAYYREKQIQGWSRAKKKALIRSDFNQLHILAECRNESHYLNVDFDCAQPTKIDFVRRMKVNDTQQSKIDCIQENESDSNSP